MRRYFEFIHDLRIFLIAFQVYSVSMFPSIVFISIDLCMDYVNRLYCNKWEKRDNDGNNDRDDDDVKRQG